MAFYNTNQLIIIALRKCNQEFNFNKLSFLKE